VAYASTSDVSVRLGSSFSGFDAAQAQILLEDAETIISSKIPNLQAQITAGVVSLQTVIRVEATAVKRVLLNPLGIKAHSEGLGDFNQSDAYDPARSSGELYVSDAEWSDLLSTLSTRRRGSIRLIAYGET
jgi:hypothetical protein